MRYTLKPRTVYYINKSICVEVSHAINRTLRNISSHLHKIPCVIKTRVHIGRKIPSVKRRFHLRERPATSDALRRKQLINCILIFINSFYQSLCQKDCLAVQVVKQFRINNVQQ